MNAIIETRALSKRYAAPRRAGQPGGRLAVNELNLAIEPGAVFGFVGPNGAGKTTTMRILTTLLQPTAGEAWVAGHSILRDPRGVRRVVGFMPDFFGVYDDMKVHEYLDFFADCYGIAARQRRSMVEDLLTLVDLSHRADDMVDSLSRGMKQRLCLARTLVHDPTVLILDEPAAGLDPRARIDIRELLRELRTMGKTVLFSSHILLEVADICTHIGVIEAGSLVASGTMDEMQRFLRPIRVIRVRLTKPWNTAQETLFGKPGVSNVRPAVQNGPEPITEFLFDLEGGDEDLCALLTDLVQGGAGVITCSEEKGNLEDVFLQITQGIVS
jgi:ABC-2 type transport system ATP-binding protein